MAYNCKRCKYCYIDYIYDDEIGEEYPIYTCKKGHDTEIDFECKDFKEYKPRKYKEKDTKCDKCKHLEECIKKYDVIDCTSTEDTRQHYMVGCGSNCKEITL